MPSSSTKLLDAAGAERYSEVPLAAVDPRALHAAHALRNLLSSDEMIQHIITDDELVLTNAQKLRLARLCERFDVDRIKLTGRKHNVAILQHQGRGRGGGNSNSDDGFDLDVDINDREGHAESQALQKPPQTTRKHDPWRSVKAMRELCLPWSVKIHLMIYGPDAYSFLLRYHGPRMVMPKDSGSIEEKLDDHFWGIYDYTVQVRELQGTDNVRWAFQMLFFFDVLCRRPKPPEKTRQLVKDTIDWFLDSLSVDRDVSSAVAAGNLEAWVKQGRTVDLFCQKFGPGCLFYLSNIISPDLLLDDMTMEGSHQAEAAEHLQALRIREEAEASRAAQLGLNIRKWLRGSFDNTEA